MYHSSYSGPWHDCQHVLESGETTSGIYLLRPQGTNRLMQAWCEQSRAQGGWTVIQRRQDGSVNFFRTWEQYKVGLFLSSIMLCLTQGMVSARSRYIVMTCKNIHNTDKLNKEQHSEEGFTVHCTVQLIILYS